MGLLADMGGGGMPLDGSADGGDINLDPMGVKKVVRVTEREKDKLNTEKFRSLKVTTAAFNDYPGAQVVVHTHGSAHAVTEQTMTGVKQDLESFVEQLRAAVTTTVGVDEDAAARGGRDEESLVKIAAITPTDHAATRHQGAVSETGFATNDQPSSDTDPNGSLPAQGAPEGGA